MSYGYVSVDHHNDIVAVLKGTIDYHEKVTESLKKEILELKSKLNENSLASTE